ncbi:phage shock protein A [Halanaerobium sp. DL-01]|uniref:S-layer homology domain-containing protein n=1 Tax=Halanaerobium sp. DL-01 TaxID=1653064 RepID=UPI000DF2ADA3|nr:S-layer homology domain-containing protein [Halanaerobium sp. DL-01]RCW81074.1 phage shock protein A [Halanaerobium sp. DL-01]
MKKLTVLLVAVMLLTAAFSVSASTFSDVPSNHWSYDAINKLVASGVITGYPDGSFRGGQPMTRYEMAVMVSRALDNIAAERAALEEKVDDMGSGLTTAQAQDVTAIVKALMEKNTNEELSDAQAEEVADMVESLTFEYKAELKVLGADIDALGKDVDKLEAKVNALEADMPKDHVEFTGTVATFAQVGDYGDEQYEKNATAEALADGDAMDLDLPTADNGGGDYDDFPAEEALWQEIDFGVNGSYKDVNFDLVVDTVTNGFRDYDSIYYGDYEEHVLGEQGDDQDFVMDTALLTVEKGGYVFTAGDNDDYTVEQYFFDDEDMEGLTLSAPFYGFDVNAFAFGYDDGADEGDRSGDEYYGVTASKVFNNSKVTGKVYNGRFDGYFEDNDGNYVTGNETVTNVAVEVQSDITDALTVNGEVVYNQVEEADTDDTMFRVNADYLFNDKWSFRGGAEVVGEEFNGGAKYGYVSSRSEADLEEDYDYDKYELGTTYVVNDNNSILFDAAMVKFDSASLSDDVMNAFSVADKADEDKTSYKLGWKNLYGKFTNHASVEFIKNDYYTDEIDDDATVVALGTVYDWSEKTNLRAEVVNKQADLYDNEDVWDRDMEYTYLKAGVDYKLAENIDWVTDVMYITGDVDQLEDVDGPIRDSHDKVDIDGSFITTSLSVSF